MKQYQIIYKNYIKPYLNNINHIKPYTISNTKAQMFRKKGHRPRGFQYDYECGGLNMCPNMGLNMAPTLSKYDYKFGQLSPMCPGGPFLQLPSLSLCC